MSEKCPKCGAPASRRGRDNIINLTEWKCGSKYCPTFAEMGANKFLQTDECRDTQISLLEKRVACLERVHPNI